MKKAYIIFPLLGVAIFTFFYVNTLSNIEQREKDKKELIAKAKEEKRQKEVADREKAYKDAVEIQEKRKADKAAKDAKDKAEKEQIANLKDDTDKTFRERERAYKAATRLGDEVKAEEEEISKLKASIAIQKAEISFLAEYTKKAQANQKSYETVLTKIEAAEKAAEAAARAAKEAAKQS